MVNDDVPTRDHRSREYCCAIFSSVRIGSHLCRHRRLRRRCVCEFGNDVFGEDRFGGHHRGGGGGGGGDGVLTAADRRTIRLVWSRTSWSVLLDVPHVLHVCVHVLAFCVAFRVRRPPIGILGLPRVFGAESKRPLDLPNLVHLRIHLEPNHGRARQGQR